MIQLVIYACSVYFKLFTFCCSIFKYTELEHVYHHVEFSNNSQSLSLSVHLCLSLCQFGWLSVS